MAPRVVVLGSGYAGAGTIRKLEDTLGSEGTELTWISDVDHHLLLHEVHRCIRMPGVADDVAIPIDRIKAPTTTFQEGRAVDVDPGDRCVHLADGEVVPYDYLVVAIGSETAHFGIPGLEEHAHTLESLEDALDIHRALLTAVESADTADPVHAVVGGAGLSGIQAAGEIAALGEEGDAPVDVTLVEGLDSVLPQGAPSLQRSLKGLLDQAGIDVETGEFVTAVTDDHVQIGETTTLSYDALIWTGGITGRPLNEAIEVGQDDRTHRLDAGSDFRTTNDRIFAVGDAALVAQNDDAAPPTAQAAWQAAEVVGTNVTRAVRNQPLEAWQYRDKGTVVSVGDRAVAHGIPGVPLDTFGGWPAQTLKKAIAARWIASVTGGPAGLSRAVRAWGAM